MRFVLLARWPEGAWNVVHEFHELEKAKKLQKRYEDRLMVVATRIVDTDVASL